MTNLNRWLFSRGLYVVAQYPFGIHLRKGPTSRDRVLSMWATTPLCGERRGTINSVVTNDVLTCEACLVLSGVI